MKISIDVDITPRELRTFFGLPDVKPLQDEMLVSIQKKMQAGVEGFDVLSIMKPLLPAQMQSLDTVQKAFWQAFSTSTNKEKGTANVKGKTSIPDEEVMPSPREDERA